MTKPRGNRMARARFPPSSCRDGSVVWVTGEGGRIANEGRLDPLLGSPSLLPWVLNPWPHPSGAWPPAPSLDLALPAWPGLVSTCALTDLPVFGCPGAPHRPLQGEEGEGGRGLSQGGKETGEKAEARCGWAAQPGSLPSDQSILVFPCVCRGHGGW